MSGAVLGAIVFVQIAGAGFVVGVTSGVRTPAKLVLAAYVVGMAEIVGLCLFLSVFDAMTRSALVVGSGAVLAAAVGVWLYAEAPLPPSLPRPALASPTRVRPVLVLGVVVALALSYVVALIVGTPPNGWDQLNYHLARAAFWVQAERVGYVENAYDVRIDSYPPNGEIALAFVLGVTRDEMFAGIVQLVAALACATGVFALARRLGFRHREAAFGALLFLTLPIVLLQASSTKNDLVVASFLVAAAVFVLGDSRYEIGVASLATALAVGTKFSASYGVVVLLVLAVVAPPRARWVLRVVAIAVGATVGLYWYALNVIESGRVLGDTSSIPGLTAPLSPAENLLEAFGLAVDAVDLSGASGADIVLYVPAAAVVAAGLLFLGRPSHDGSRRAAVGASLVVSPLALYVLTNDIGRPVLLELHDLLGEPQAYIPSDEDPNSSPTLASDTGSWFGPVGLLLGVGVGSAAVILVRRGNLPRWVLVPAAAPLAWYVLVSLSLTYHPWEGRFFVFPIALSASLWGLVLRRPVVAWAMAALAAATAALSLVHYAEKPSGLRLLDRSVPASVWPQERWQVQSSHDPAVGPIFRVLDEEIPKDEAVALALGANDFGYPAFGPQLERRVELLPFGSNGAAIDTNWLVANPERAAEIDTTCWQAVLESEGGTVFRRLAEACPVPSSAAS